MSLFSALLLLQTSSFAQKKTFVLQGEKGEKGDKGQVGNQGPKGDKGDKGEPGTNGVPVITVKGKSYSAVGTFAGAAKDNSGKAIKTHGLIQGGWSRVKALCETTYGKTAHMCTEEEVYRSIQLGVLGKFSGVKGSHWYATSKKGTNNCYDWTINTSSGTGGMSGAMGWFVNGDGSQATGRCETSFFIACCK